MTISCVKRFWNSCDVRTLVRCASIGLAGALASGSALADASSNFDQLNEGFLDKVVEIDGITFYNCRVLPFDNEDTVFVIENAVRYFDEHPDLDPYFSRPNLFQFAGYISGEGWLINRFYKFSFTTGQVETFAEFDLFYEVLPEFLGTKVSFQGLRNGKVVVEDSFVADKAGKEVLHRKMRIGGVPFDEMRMICTGGGYGIFGSMDNLFIKTDMPSDLSLSAPTPGNAGENNTITASWPTQGDEVIFAYSTRPGSTSLPGCSGVAVGLQNPKILGREFVDANGDAVHQFFVPTQARGRAVYFQAVQQGACAASNRVSTTFN